MLIRFLIVIILTMISLSNLIAHDQVTHQHITREAFKLLKKSFPTELSDMEEYIGTSDVWSGSSADGSFGALKIVSGAYLEDEYDVVYGYGLTQQPDYNQVIPTNTLISMFGSLREAHTSITHFWNADNGENASTFLNDDSDFGYWSFSIPKNAMTKMRKYINGYYDFAWAYENEIMSWTWCGVNSLQLVTKFDTPGIVNFYKSIEAFEANSYLAEDAYWYSTDCPSWGPEYILFQKAHAYEILGRMCHLLEDMSVPAHVHNDAHAGNNGMYEDYYEVNVPNLHQWTADEIYSFGGTYINPYNEWDDPVFYLMYFLNQITDHYASGRTDGDDNIDATCPNLEDIIPVLGLPMETDEINYSNIVSMHNVLYPLAIRAAAGLMYWFAVETGQLPDPTPPVPPSVSISGPTSLGYNELGYFTASPSGGSGTYTNYHWWSRDDNGFPPERTSFDDDLVDEAGNLIRRPPAVWIEMTEWEGEQTISKSSPVNFSLKCEVTDFNSDKDTDIHSVSVSGGFRVKQLDTSTETMALLSYPEEFELTGNYPNPFNPKTVIRYQLSVSSPVTLQIYDITGRLVEALVNGEVVRGYHTLQWDASNHSSGMYFVQMVAGEFVETQKILLLK